MPLPTMRSSSTESQAQPPAPTSFWRDIRLALRGSQCDYTHEPLNRAILLLAVPMMLEALMESTFAIVAVFWVSHLGADAIAIVGLTESVMALIYAVAIGISVAATAIISRRIGEKDSNRAAQFAAQIVMLGIAAAAVLGILFGYFAFDILKAMGASAPVMELGGYAQVMFSANVTVLLIFVINAIFRGAGDAVLAMRTLVLANVLNILLAPCLIFGWGPFPEMGVTGAAVATNIGRGVGLLYQLRHLTGRHSRIRVGLRHFRLKPDILSLVLRTSAHGIFQLLVSTTSWIALFKILTAFGSVAVAGYTIAARIVVFALLPASGLATAAATLVGQNLGALKPERAEAAVRVAARLNVTLLTAAGVLFALFAQPIVGLFTTEPEVLSLGVLALRIISVGFPLYAIGMCFSAAFNGAGDTWTPTRTSFVCFWFGQIPMAWLLSNVFGLGPLGVYIAAPIALWALAIWNYALFRRGTWKAHRI